MKRFFFFLAVPFLGGSLMAQTNHTSSGEKLQRSTPVMMVKNDQANGQTSFLSDPGNRAEPVWSDTFENLDNWILTDQSPDPYGWVHRTGNYTPSITGGTGFETLLSTTADNGYAFIDSDGSPYFGDGTGRVVAQMTTATPIDCSDLQFVWLTFQHNYRWWQDLRGVRVSGDNGATWIDYQITVATAPDPQSSANPEFTQIDVSEAAAGSDQVLVEFYYDDQDFWAWYWAVDDVALSPPFDNDLVLEEAYRGEWPKIYDDTFASLPEGATLAQWAEVLDDYAYTRGYEYSWMPAEELNIHPVLYLRNNGFQEATGVTAHCIILDPDSVEHVFSSQGDVSLSFLEETRIDFPIDLNAEFGGEAPAGLYRVSFMVDADVEDEFMEDNIIEGTPFRVNAGEAVAHDFGTNVAESYYIDPHNGIWGSRVAFDQPATITAVSFVLAPNRNYITGGSGFPVNPTWAVQRMVEELVFPNIREASVLNPASPNNPATALFGQTQLEYVIEEEVVSSDGANLIHINFALDEPIEVDPTKVYQAEVFYPPLQAGDTAWAWVPTVVDAGGIFAGVIRDLAEASTFGQGWFSVANVPYFRLVLEGEPTSTSPLVTKLDFSMGQNYPNPVNGNTTIDWALDKPMKNIRFSITDNTGRTVYEKDMGDRPAGPQEPIMLDMSRFAAGVYQYGLTIGQDRLVRKMMITK